MAWLISTSWILLIIVGKLVLDPYQRNMGQSLELVRSTFPKVPRIQTAELAGWLDDGSRIPPQLLDVRTESEFNTSHLPGARRVSPSIRIPPLIAGLDPKRTTVLYCSIGYRSSELASGLLAAGYTNLLNLEGSIFAWANEGRPLVNMQGPAIQVHPYSYSYGLLLKREVRAPLSPAENLANEYFSWPDPVKTSCSIVLLALFLAWESFAPFVDYFQRGGQNRTIHGLRNLSLGLINTLLIAIIFARLWMSAANLSAERGIGLLHWLDMPEWLRWMTAILLLDGWTYCWHRMNHAIPWLWVFHRVHHSELHMDVTSASRFHPGEIIFSSLLRIPVIVALGIEFKELLAYEAVMFAVVQFHHSNIQVPPRLDRILRQLLVTPSIHCTHHSQDAELSNSNYSSFLSLWDRIFGTRAAAGPAASIPFGLEGFLNENQHTLPCLLQSPLNAPVSENDTPLQPGMHPEPRVQSK